MAIYGELKNGYLINIGRTLPAERNTPYEIVELSAKPPGTGGDAYEYDRDNKVAVVSTLYRNKQTKRELVVLMEKKKAMQDVASQLGLDYTDEIAEIDAAMNTLAAGLA